MASNDGLVILWPEVCGSPGVFWDDAVTVNTPTPDFPDCFQDTVVVWVPCFILWFGMPFWLSYLAALRYRHSLCHFSCLNAIKQVVCALLLGLRVAHMVLVGLEEAQAPLSRWLADIVYIPTLALSIFLSRREFRKGVHSSGLLFCFWLLLMLSSIVPFYSQAIRWRKGAFNDVPSLGCALAFFVLSTIQFCIHLFSDYGAFGHRVGQKEACGTDSEKKPLLADDERTDKQNGVLVHRKTETQSLLGDPPPKRKGNKRSHDQDRPPNPSPELWASFLSAITFVWCTPLLLLGYKRQLGGEKLYDLHKSEQAKPVMKKFYVNWLKSSRDKSRRYEDSSYLLVDDVTNTDALPGYQTIHGRKSKRARDTTGMATWKTDSSIVWSLAKTFGAYYAMIGIFEVFNILLTFSRPLIQDALIGYVESTTSFPWQGYIYAFSLFGITIVRAMVNQQHFLGKMTAGMRVRSALTSAVYRKALLLANSARKDYSLGEIVNLMAVDAQRVGDCCFFIHTMWSAPLNIIVAMVLLWQYLGAVSLGGLAVLLVMMFCNLVLARIVKKLQVHTMRLKDKRTKLTNEILNGIKVLKLYAWEEAFQKRLLDIRDQELAYIKKSSLYLSGTVISFSCAPILFAMVVFSSYIALSDDGTISASVAFVSLSLLSSVTRPLTVLPNGIAQLIQAQVSISRLEEYLNNDELDPNAVITTDKTGDSALRICDGSFSWEGPQYPNVLNDIDVEVKTGSLTCVIGPVGCGKSSLLAAVLGELHKSYGDVYKRGSVAYVPQEAWIRNDTLEKNVLFGQPMNRDQYNQALDACALRPDLNMLAHGDQTEIGEKGINLSGGQKQRVSLARAVYCNRDIYLLDDPLSAVDSHVGKHIFNEVIGSTGLLKHKTRVLVTHSLTHLPKADQIIVMLDGRVSEIGGYKELLMKKGDFSQLILTYLNQEEEEDDEELDQEEIELRKELQRQLSDLPPSQPASVHASFSSSFKRRKSRVSLGRSLSRPPPEEGKGKGGRGAPGGEVGKPGGRGPRLIDAEATQTGGVNFRVLGEYLVSVGLGLVTVVMLSAVMQIATDLGSNIWLSEWSGDTELEAQNLTYMDPFIRIGVYSGLGISTTVSVAIQTVCLAVGCVIGSRMLHEKLLVRIMQAPMSFFDTTPLGRILNRFSQDMNVADSSVRMTVIAVLRGMASLVTTIIAITYTTPIFLAVIIPLAIGYYFLQRFYVMTSNQLRRIMNVRTSPMYSHFGETVAGASSVRAYQRQTDFIEDSDVRLDNMQMSKFPAIIINRWLSVWLEFLGSLVVLFAALFAILSKGNITGGLVGLSITYSLQITDRLAMFLRNVSDLESNVVSLERIQEYSSVEQEADWHIPGNAPPLTWPEQGRISINNYSTRYRPGLDLILKNLFCNIKGQEKIGIVGRTGAGKSSMTLALFRIIEAVEGAITIDEIDTSAIGLHDLRSRITIIPQDPTLFSGTLRFNLDPLETRPDSAIWDALGHAHLKQFVEMLPEGLEHECTEGGSNLSVGQRQLVCLARALLRKTKILVLDEATAAIDMETDHLIQNTIRQEFANCTVLTIAHRINTVMDYDRVMVLADGQIKEFDSPAELLDDENSAFRAMCKDAGVLSQDPNQPTILEDQSQPGDNDSDNADHAAV